MNSLRTIVCLLLLTGVAAADPAITAVGNAASNTPAGLPHSGIPQGSLFIAYGSDLGGGTFVVADTFPLSTEIAGTSAQITVNGTTVDGIMYYAGATQVAIILPSATPLGDGTLTITYDGKTSPPFPINVVKSAFGVFTVSQNGSGDAIAYLGASLVTPSNAANAEDILSFWGTGLGAVGFDETMAAQQFDMTDIPLEAYIGGRHADTVFRGRNACCSSVDAAYVKVPPGVYGCAVPVTFKIGNVVSNTTTIAVAEEGRTCTPANPTYKDVDFSAWFTTGRLSTGGFALQRAVSISPPYTANGVDIPGSTTRSDAASATFFRFDGLAGGAGLGDAFDIANYGGCTVYSFSGQIPPIPVFTALDAGDPLTVDGPPGNIVVPKQVFPGTIAYSAPLDQTGTTITPGLYNFSGPGGPDVGAFSVDLTVPPELIWTNQEDTFEVDRTQGVTVNWTGGDPNGYVQIQGQSFVALEGGAFAGSSFDCTAKTTDGTYTVDPVVLLALPETTLRNVGGLVLPNFGTLSVNSFTTQIFAADGLDFGTVNHTLTNGNSVEYK